MAGHVQPAGDALEAAVRPVDEHALTPADLRDKLQLTQSTFYKHQALGRFERFELRPRIGPRRYSRRLVQQYLDGEPSSRGWAQPAAVRRSR